MNWYRNFLLPTGLLAGTVIGAGVFALPYLFAKAGFAVGFASLALGAAAYAVVHLLYADLILRTPGEHRFVGFARMHLGRVGFFFSIAMAVLEMVFVLTIYLILSVSFANLLVSGPDLLKLLVFWALGSAAIFLSLRRLALSELLVTLGMVAIIGVMFFLGVGEIAHTKTFELFTGRASLFLVLGPALFALSGRVAIPSVVNYFREHEVTHGRRAIRRAVIAGSIVPAIVYGLFVVGVLGISPTVTEDAVSGLAGGAHPFFIFLVGILGLISLWSSYIVVGLDVSSILRYDLKFSRITRFAAVILGPLLLYFSGFQSFITLVSFVGGIFLGFEGILIVTMWLKARRYEPFRPPLLKKVHGFFLLLTVLVFAGALVYEIIRHLP